VEPLGSRRSLQRLGGEAGKEMGRVKIIECLPADKAGCERVEEEADRHGTSV